MTPQDLAVLIGIFFAVTLTGGFIMDWFEKKNPGGNRGLKTNDRKINVQ